jgi:hypothetical protein
VLGNKSPRAAVKTAKGRAKVVDWLKTLENHTAKFAGIRPTPPEGMVGQDREEANRLQRMILVDCKAPWVKVAYSTISRWTRAASLGTPPGGP